MEIGTLMAFLGVDKGAFDQGLDAARSKMSSTADSAGSSSDSMADKIDRNFGKIAVAGVAAGTALEGFARTQAPLTEGLGRVSQATGIAEDELRGLALEASNVTFPLDEAIGLMELGSQQGLRSAEALGTYATFWDTVGDATGESSQELAKAGSALRAVGIEAGNESEALAAFGYVTQNTTSSVGDLLGFVERTGPQLRDMGLGVNETAGMLGALEHELGMSGRTARQEFRKAVNEADGDLGKMLETLGLSQETFAEYTGKVAESGDTIQGLADNHAESYTWIQKVQHGASEAMFRFGEYGDAAAALALPLMALGPISKGVAGFFRLMGSTALINGAKMAAGWLLAMGPIALVIAAVVGLAVLIIANWDRIKGATVAAWNAVTSAVSAAWSFVRGLVSSAASAVVGFVSNAWSSAVSFTTSAWSRLVSAVQSGASRAVSFVASLPGRFLSALGSLGSLLVGAGRSLVDGLWRGIQNAWAGLKSRVSGLLGSLRNLLPFSPAKEGPFSGTGYTTFSGRAMVRDLARGIRSGEGEVVGALEGVMAAGADVRPGAPSLAGRVRGGDGAQADALYRAVLDALDGARMEVDGRGMARLVNRQNLTGSRRGRAPAI